MQISTRHFIFLHSTDEPTCASGAASLEEKNFFFRKKVKKVSETYERCGGERGEVGGKAQAWTGGA